MRDLRFFLPWNHFLPSLPQTQLLFFSNMVLSSWMRELGAARVHPYKLPKHILTCSLNNKHQGKCSHAPARRTSGWASPSPWSGTASPQNLLAARSAESWITTLNVFDPAEVDTSCLKVVFNHLVLFCFMARAGPGDISFEKVVLLNGCCPPENNYLPIIFSLTPSFWTLTWKM